MNKKEQMLMVFLNSMEARPAEIFHLRIALEPRLQSQSHVIKVSSVVNLGMLC